MLQPYLVEHPRHYEIYQIIHFLGFPVEPRACRQDHGSGERDLLHVAYRYERIRRFSQYQDELLPLFERDFGGPVYEVLPYAVGYLAERLERARHHDHGIRWVRAGCEGAGEIHFPVIGFRELATFGFRYCMGS